MKFSARAGDLATTVAFARRGVEAKTKFDILKTMLLRTSAGGGVEIIGHSLTRMHIACPPATVHTPGTAAVPADRLTGLIGAMPPNATVTITSADATVTVMAECSRCRLPALPAIDFPMELATKAADVVAIDLGAGDFPALLRNPTALVNEDDDRVYLRGPYLHTTDGKLAVAVTDGTILLYRLSAIPAPSWPGIIVPPAMIEEIDRLARRNKVVLRTDGRRFEARVDDGRLAVVSKLIDAVFPDYGRVIPAPAAAAVTFATADMLAALARLAAASSHERPTAGMTWDGGDALSLCLVHEDGIATDAIAATTTSRGCVACTAARLTKVIEAMDAARLRLSVDATPGAGLRLDAPADPGVVAVIAPIYWRGATSAARPTERPAP